MSKTKELTKNNLQQSSGGCIHLFDKFATPEMIQEAMHETKLEIAEDFSKKHGFKALP